MAATVRSGFYGASASSASSATISEATGSPQSGDVRYVFMINSPGATITVPSGWTVLQNGNTPSTRTGAIFYRTYVPGVGTQTVTFSSGVVSIIVVSVAGADTAAAPQFSLAGANATGTTATATGLTPTTADQLALVWGAFVFNSPQTGADTVTLTPPSGGTQAALARPSGSTTGYSSTISTIPITSTAATGNYVTTSSATTTSQLASLVLVPALATAPTVRPGQFFPFLGLGTGVAR